MSYTIQACETGELLTANPFQHWKTQDIYSHSDIILTAYSVEVVERALGSSQSLIWILALFQPLVCFIKLCCINEIS